MKKKAKALSEMVEELSKKVQEHWASHLQNKPILLAPPLEVVPAKKYAGPYEEVVCPHCKVTYHVEGDIKTWDVVYLTCLVCFAKGHRRMPANCGVCAEGLAGFAKEVAKETLKEIEKAEKKPEKDDYPRNILF